MSGLTHRSRMSSAHCERPAMTPSLHLVKGLVEETVPDRAPAQISLLRLDTDWYESTNHELVHLFVGASPGTRRWHGREFKTTLRRAMREGYGIGGVTANGCYHGSYADALERRRSQAPALPSKKLHPGQLALIGSAVTRS